MAGGGEGDGIWKGDGDGTNRRPNRRPARGETATTVAREVRGEGLRVEASVLLLLLRRFSLQAIRDLDFRDLGFSKKKKQKQKKTYNWFLRQ